MFSSYLLYVTVVIVVMSGDHTPVDLGVPGPVPGIELQCWAALGGRADSHALSHWATSPSQWPSFSSQPLPGVLPGVLFFEGWQGTCRYGKFWHLYFPFGLCLCTHSLSLHTSSPGLELAPTHSFSSSCWFCSFCFLVCCQHRKFRRLYINISMFGFFQSTRRYSNIRLSSLMPASPALRSSCPYSGGTFVPRLVHPSHHFPVVPIQTVSLF